MAVPRARRPESSRFGTALDPGRLDRVRERELAAVNDAHLTRDEIEARADAIHVFDD
ncbi:hypothetical protein [Halocalculus aciditolerans]|uniref:Uncharacterized protein n=1 Tax=Halocalculus aciditolerans TaxID=1383812 RepID=A0A830FKJ9_9EURY|nr:hypothetical protein [Halocalculus aciditolerans]GGL64959.1 hypothetical protein GCM10009039_23650 [Halocalculus aciditolerans]